MIKVDDDLFLKVNIIFVISNHNGLIVKEELQKKTVDWR
jgi:hypothetical protein